MTDNDFLYKWGKQRFARNDHFGIQPEDLQEFALDAAALFGGKKATGAVLLDQHNDGTTSWLLSPDLAQQPARLRLVRLGSEVTVPAPAPVAHAPTVTAPGAPFAPTTVAVPAGAPQIAKCTPRAEAGESLILSVVQADGSVEGRLYCAGNLYQATGYVQNHAAVFQLPSDLPSATALFWLKGAAGEGAPVLLNRTQVDWVERHLAPGEVGYLYGAALEDCTVFAQAQAGGPVVECAVLSNDGFEVGYRVPGLEPGPVWLWAHNRRFGTYGWSERHAAVLEARAQHLRTRAWDGPRADLLLAAAAPDNGQRVRQGLATARGGVGLGTVTLNPGAFPVERSIFVDNGRGRLVGAVDGQGRPTTTLYPAPNFVSEGYGLLGSPFSVRDFVVENVNFTNPDHLDLGGENALLGFKQLRGVRFRNCTITNPTGQTLRFGADPDGVPGEQVYLDEVWHEGSGAATGETDYLYVRGGGYKARQNADSMYNNTGARFYAFSHLTVGDAVPSSQLLEEVGVGRVLKAGLNSGSMECGYLGHCTGLGIGPLPNVPDPNQAEIHMIEGAYLTWQGFPSAQGARTLTFPQAIAVNDNKPWLLKTEGVVPGKHLVQIQEGPGRGLCFGLVACDGHTLTLDRDLPVTLTSESRVAVGLFHRTITMVFNRFTGRKGITTGGFTAQTGAQVYGGGVDWTIENNEFEELYNGVVISGTHEKTDSVAASMFLTVRGNIIKDCGRAYLLFVVPNEQTAWSFSTTAVFGVNLSRNVVSGSVRGDLGFEAPRDAAEMALCPVPPLDYLVSDQPFAGEVRNYYRAAEVGQSPKPLYAGTTSNLVVQAAAAAGFVQGGASGVAEALPAFALSRANVLSYVAPFAHVLTYLSPAGEQVPLNRTITAGAGGPATPGTPVDAYTKLESDARYGDRATQRQHTQQLSTLRSYTAGTGIDLTGGVITATGSSLVGQHTTFDGARVTGPIQFRSARPAGLQLTAISNVAMVAMQVNYRDVSRDGIWVAGMVHTSASAAPADLAALLADVEADIAAVPAPALALAAEVLLRTQPIDATLESDFFLNGLRGGNFFGRSIFFRTTYTGPPIGNVVLNPQFRDASAWVFPYGGGSVGNGQLNLAGRADGDHYVKCFQFQTVQADTYTIELAVLQLDKGSLTLQIQGVGTWSVFAPGTYTYTGTVPTSQQLEIYLSTYDSGILVSHLYMTPV